MRVFVKVRQHSYTLETVDISFEYEGDTSKLKVSSKKITDGNKKTIFTSATPIWSVSAEMKTGDGVKRRQLYKDLMEVTANDTQFK